MKKHRLSPLLLSALLLLSSCTSPADIPQDAVTSLPDTIRLKAEPGTVRTVLEEVRQIKEYEFIETELNTILHPGISIGSDAVYMMNSCPDEEAERIIRMTMEEEQAYTAAREPDTVFEIEEYEDIMSSVPSRVVTLKGLPEYELRAHHHLLTYDASSQTLLLPFSERPEDAWTVWFYVFDTDGNLLNRYPKPELLEELIGFPDTWFYLNNSIYYWVEEPYSVEASAFEYRIHRYDPITGEDTVIDTENVVRMFVSEGVLYYFTQNFDEYGFADSLNLLRLDGEESTLIHGDFAPASRVPYNPDYDPERQILYYGDSYNVYSYHFDDGVTRQIMVSGDKIITKHGIMDGYLILSNGHYATSVYKPSEEKVSLNDNLQTLNLFRQTDETSDNASPNIFRLMSNNGYYAKGHQRGIGNRDDYQFTLAKKLLAGDTDFDIFYVSTEMSELFDSMYYEDLSRYPLLRGYYDRMIPGVEELCTVDGIPALIPLNLYTTSMQVNKSCVTGDVTLARTLEDLPEILDDIPLKSGNYLMAGTSLYILMHPWFEQLISNYMADVITDRQAQKDLKMLFDLAYDLKEETSVYLGSGSTRLPVLLKNAQNIGLDGSLKPDHTAVPMMKISDDYKQTWTGGFYAVNPNSPNKELAVMFLACLMEQDRNSSLGNFQLYEGAQKKENTAYGNGSDALYEIFLTQLAEGIRGYEIPDFISTLRGLFKKIDRGEYTAADAAEELFRQMKMIKYE